MTTVASVNQAAAPEPYKFNALSEVKMLVYGTVSSLAAGILLFGPEKGAIMGASSFLTYAVSSLIDYGASFLEGRVNRLALDITKNVVKLAIAVGVAVGALFLMGNLSLGAYAAHFGLSVLGGVIFHFADPIGRLAALKA